MRLAQTEVIRPFVYSEALVGSRVTCNPAPTDTDCDVLVKVHYIGSSGKNDYVTGKYSQMYDVLYRDGWTLGGSGQDDSEFESWTKGDINLILTDSEDFYQKFLAATSVCKRLNLLDKEDRKALFRACLYAECCYIPPAEPVF